MLTAEKTTVDDRQPVAAPVRSLRRTTRLAGALYLVNFIAAPFAFMLGRATILEPGDAAATAQNLAANEALFRAGMLAEVVVFLVEIVLAGLLYGLLRPVNRSLSLAAALARGAEAVIQAANLLTSAVVLMAVGRAGYLAVFETEQLDAVAMAALDANETMILVWGLFFGLHLLLLGYLVYRSEFFPRFLGVLLVAGSVGYFAESAGTLMFPGLADPLSTVVLWLAIPSELAFALWLLVKGIDTDVWHRRSMEPSPL